MKVGWKQNLYFFQCKWGYTSTPVKILDVTTYCSVQKISHLWYKHKIWYILPLKRIVVNKRAEKQKSLYAFTYLYKQNWNQIYPLLVKISKIFFFLNQNLFFKTKYQDQDGCIKFYQCFKRIRFEKMILKNEINPVNLQIPSCFIGWYKNNINLPIIL